MDFSPCSLIGHEPVSLCPPLQRLKDEHGPLNEEKYALFVAAKGIYDGKEEDVVQALIRLREKVQQFLQHLDPHSRREEDVLFPMMERYIGKQFGPIAVMEYEHQEAKQNIATFLQKTETIRSEEAKQLASYVMNAYMILTDHFAKEEQVLFPMAEKLLSAEEKEQLAKRIDEIKG
ncbi:hemerythrin domain-containing protein [Anoxybacillus sp. LAT_35]|uniref:Hemerythrin n=1 Tax=Anoxybacillus kestanbolensis TaxID=227476 RepID=A0A1V3FSZ0_9BACL|nr:MULTISPECIES: hemerythrin domain-containing protein [Anoxybacillus]MCG5024387.1 hemerythrin domain-containing protein [Anoxybacillus flavithermus]MCG6198404.1 hemerythrin domain-containing protein [Anoxybacillus sp. LAT_38]MCG3085660.1 hemerythrin domain-containing protein [Anoxybacillus sp. LAT27]MCG6172016.1 hemerythrin domain-containing protein [Anoxybacillus sp. LAT_11]MCG6174184.1 hemerythrin domain-containing protein [Anoxybacillus sp. LAT_31]